MEIIKNTANTFFDGCDFVVHIEEKRKIKILQLTDMQMIDSSQMRTPDRLRRDEINAWRPENLDPLCGDQIRSLVAQTNPDLIFITGDIVYGSFDDSGRSFVWFCELMDSFGIPWAPVFGNHDNESKMGVAWQCERFSKSKYCLFKRGSVSGNGNYTVGIAVGDELLRVIHMLDSNGCSDCSDADVIKQCGIYPDQIELVRANAAKIRAAQGRGVEAFMAFHIPTDTFAQAERGKGYLTDERKKYILGVDVPARDGDFGCKREEVRGCVRTEGFFELLDECNVNGVFAGHYHSVNTCIEYRGIKWVYGLKTGQYDYHTVGQLGGTLITLDNEEFFVQHVPSLVPCGLYPKGAPMFREFFAEDK